MSLTLFEWKLDNGWSLEERFEQKLTLEKRRDPGFWKGPLLDAAREALHRTKDVSGKKERHSSNIF